MLSTRASPLITIAGGICGVPSAVRIRLPTITSFTNDVTIVKTNGAIAIAASRMTQVPHEFVSMVMSMSFLLGARVSGNAAQHLAEAGDARRDVFGLEG